MFGFSSYAQRSFASGANTYWYFYVLEGMGLTDRTVQFDATIFPTMMFGGAPLSTFPFSTINLLNNTGPVGWKPIHNCQPSSWSDVGNCQ